MTVEELNKLTERILADGKGEIRVCVGDGVSYKPVREVTEKRLSAWGFRLLEVDDRSIPEHGAMYLVLIGEAID